MRTLREAAALLRAATTVRSLQPIAAAVGCEGAPAPLDEPVRHALGLGVAVREARIAPGPGALRALLLELRPERPLREILSEAAARLTTRVPHVLWLVIAAQPGTGQVAIAAWSVPERAPRLAALLAHVERITESDAETLRALAAAAGRDDLLVHARWVELLGREALSRRFYRKLEQRVRALAASAGAGTPAERAEIALLHASRLLFLAFLEAKGWLDGDRDFLVRQVERCAASGGAIHRRLLRPLFFGTLNTPVRRRAPAARCFGAVPFLNGGLFAPTATERRLRALTFTDDAIGALVSDLLAHYRFTVREESADWAEAAIDPEMLGHAFESLMASDARRAGGAYYTPHALVRRATDAALMEALARRIGPTDAGRALAGAPLGEESRHALAAALSRLTVLDPACGSGAFLVHALERLTELARLAGDVRPLATVRRELLTRAIFGVDRSAMAVWLCELRLWLAVVIDTDGDGARVPPLPNLDRNVRVGDSLGTAIGAVPCGDAVELARVRARYARASGHRKLALLARLERLERRAAVAQVDARIVVVHARRRDLATAARALDLFSERHRIGSEQRVTLARLRADAKRLRAERERLLRGGTLPFSFATHFADVLAGGGFQVVVGNPPWVRPHRLPPAERARLRAAFTVAREGAWRAGAALAGAAPGFAAQVDLAALFVERAVGLLAPGGALAFLLPSKLWRSLAGGGLRRFLLAETRLLAIEDHAEGAPTFDAAVYPSLVVAAKGRDEPPPVVAVRRAMRGRALVGWYAAPRSLGLDASPGAPWLLAPREVREAFDLVRATGTPLAGRPCGRPTLGVKCGCNAAFVVRVAVGSGARARVRALDGSDGYVERELLRPVIRGESLRAWRIEDGGERIVWTHRDDGRPLDDLPEHARAWLERWRRRLARRADAGAQRAWWELFRTEAARPDRPRVAWADLGRAPRAVVLEAGDRRVPLNSCYVAPCRGTDDALALAAVLNSPLAAAWLGVLAEPARGGYRRFLGWTMALLPLPADWERARAVLVPLAERAHRGGDLPPSTLLEAVLDAYQLRRRDVAALIAWNEP